MSDLKLIRRDAQGRYLPGNPPGPGRPANSPPRLVTALRAALDEDETLERLRAVAIRKMEEGDPAFWRMLMDRIWPAKLELGGHQGGPITFEHIVRAARDGGTGESGTGV